MKKIAQVLGSRRLTADVVMSMEVSARLGPRFSFDFLIPHGAEYRDELLRTGARVITLGDPASLSRGQILAFARYFRANPADVVHTHVSFSARVGARLAGIRRCVSTRGFFDEESSGGGLIRMMLYNAFTSATVCHLACMRDALVRQGARDDRLFPLYPSVCRSDPDEGARAALPHGRVSIICPLPYYRGFGQETLVRAFARLPESLCDRLIFAGAGPLEEEYKNLANRLGVGERVEFYGEKMSTKVYNTPDYVVVLTQESRWEMPKLLLTGVASPIIASDTVANKELLQGACEFFHRGDEYALERAILRLLNDADAFATAGRRAALAGVSMDLVCELHERVYAEA